MVASTKADGFEKRPSARVLAFYTKTYLKHFKILYPPQYFIKLKLKLPVDFYFYYNFLLAVFYNNNIENYYEAIKLGKN